MSSRNSTNFNSENFGLSLLRAGACLSILFGHCLYWIGYASKDVEEFYHRVDVLWATVTINAMGPAMDVFLVLTGLFAGLELIPSLEKTSDNLSCVFRYYQKRAARLIPGYYCTLVFAYLVLYPMKASEGMDDELRRAFFTVMPFPDACQKAKWASFVFAQNQYPMMGCMGYTWSLAVQVQFYLLLPLVLLLLQPKTPQFRRRVFWTCVAACGAVLALRAKLLRDPRIRMPLPLLGPHTPENDALTLYMLEKSYYTLFPRLNALAFGVMAALIYSNTQMMDLFNRHRRMVKYMLGVMVASICGGLGMNILGAREDPTHPFSQKGPMFFSFVIFLGVVHPATIALAAVYVASAEKKPNEKVAATVSWFAKQTYDVFLLHPLLLMLIFSVFPPSTWFFTADTSPAAKFFAVGALTLALSAFAGYLQRAVCAVFVPRLSDLASAAFSKARNIWSG